MVEALIAAGSRVEYARPKDGATALIAACEYGHVAVVRILLRAGADPNQAYTSESAYSPLIQATGRGFVQIVDELISAGANVNYATPTVNIEKGFIPGATALIAACESGHVDVVRILLRAGADPNQALTNEGARSPLIQASIHGFVQIVDELISAGANVNYATPTGNIEKGFIPGTTALLVACVQGHVAVVRILLRAGADPNQVLTDERAHSPLIQASIRGFVQIVDEVISAGANVNYATPTGNIEKGFIPGTTALIVACERGHVTVVRSLLRAVADPNQACTDENSHTPLFQASGHGFVQIVDELISAGANVNYTRPNDGSTSLMFAARFGFVDVVRSLLAAGADPRTAKHDGHTALDIALHCNHPAIAALLKTKIAELSGST